MFTVLLYDLVEVQHIRGPKFKCTNYVTRALTAAPRENVPGFEVSFSGQ